MGKKGPHNHHRHEWFVNEERIRSLKDIGNLLEKIGKLLSDRGSVKLDKYDIKPPESCYFIMRYERMPAGELSLKLELMWDEDQENNTSNEKEIKIE
jgi:hypothetical protein